MNPMTYHESDQAIYNAHNFYEPHNLPHPSHQCIQLVTFQSTGISHAILIHMNIQYQIINSATKEVLEVLPKDASIKDMIVMQLRLEARFGIVTSVKVIL